MNADRSSSALITSTTVPDPKDLKLTWLPDDEDLIPVLVSFEPHRSKGYSFSQEPGLVLLPDGRLFTAMRTANGQVWYTVSDDHGHSWRETEILRFKDGGDPVLNPIAPTPIFRLEDGRYILFHQNHDGFGYGGRGPLDLNSRRPQFLSVGEFREGSSSAPLVQRAAALCRYAEDRGLPVQHALAVDVCEPHGAGRAAHLLVYGPENLRAGALHHGRDAGRADGTSVTLLASRCRHLLVVAAVLGAMSCGDNGSDASRWPSHPRAAAHGHCPRHVHRPSPRRPLRQS